MNEPEFVGFVLKNLRGAGFVTIQAKTEPTLTAEGKAVLGVVTKTARVNGTINWIYAKSVNRQRTREGKPANFEAYPRRWGYRLKGMPFIVHVTKPSRKGEKGEHRLYLEMKVERSLGHEYWDAKGKPLAAEIVEPLLQDKKGAPRQWLKKEIIPRDYQVQNITGMRINKQEI